MTNPKIENSDRGITLNKSLAWTIGCGLVGAGLWAGIQLTGLSAGVGSLSGDIEEIRVDALNQRADRVALEARIRTLENGAARRDARFDAVAKDISEVKQGQDELNRLIRQLLQQGN